MEDYQKLLNCSEEEKHSIIQNRLNYSLKQIIGQVTKKFNLTSKDMVPNIILVDNPEYWAHTISNKIEISLPFIWLYSDFLLLFVNWIPILENHKNYFIHPVINFDDTSHYLKSIINSISTRNLEEYKKNRPITIDKFLRMHESQRKLFDFIYYHTESYIIAHEIGHWLQNKDEYNLYYRYDSLKEEIIKENINIIEKTAKSWAGEILSDIFALDILLAINSNLKNSSLILSSVLYSFIPLIIIEEERKKSQNEPINHLNKDHPPSLMRIDLVRRYARALLNIIDDFGQRVEQIAFYLYSHEPNDLKEFYIDQFNIANDLDLNF